MADKTNLTVEQMKEIREFWGQMDPKKVDQHFRFFFKKIRRIFKKRRLSKNYQT